MQQPKESEIQVFHAQICQALADPTRILLLYHLADGPKSVGALADSLGISQLTVSRHLKVLRERGMVMATRYGATIECRLVDDRPIQALDLLRSVMHDNLTRNAELVSALRDDNETHSES
jgi:ArsR family transcriptional regulator